MLLPPFFVVRPQLQGALAALADELKIGLLIMLDYVLG